jgi:hypothetical protein
VMMAFLLVEFQGGIGNHMVRDMRPVCIFLILHSHLDSIMGIPP